MKYLTSALLLIVLSASSALSCTCVSPEGATVRAMMAESAAVFRGVVIERKLLPARPEMRTRNRYAITFRIQESWKGTSQRAIVIYGMDGGTDCLGGDRYKVGTAYLVFADEQKSQDVSLGEFFWFGWTDILPQGSPMLVPSACKPGAEITSAENTVRELGKGRTP